MSRRVEFADQVEELRRLYARAVRKYSTTPSRQLAEAIHRGHSALMLAEVRQKGTR